MTTHPDDSGPPISLHDLQSALGPSFFTIEELRLIRESPDQAAAAIQTAFGRAIRNDRLSNWDGIYGKWVLYPVPNGPRMWLRLGDTVSHGILRATREDRAARYIKSKLSRGGTFIDAGANVGWFTLNAAQRYKELGAGRVVAFEPQALQFTYLDNSVRENGLDNVNTFQVALGGEERMVSMTDAGMNSGGSMIVLEEAGEPHTVPMKRLDSVVPADEPVDCIKLDIEGAEALFLDGAAGLLARRRPPIYSEINPRKLEMVSGVSARQFIERLLALGYQAHVLRSDGVPSRITVSDQPPAAANLAFEHSGKI